MPSVIPILLRNVLEGNRDVVFPPAFRRQLLRPLDVSPTLQPSQLRPAVAPTKRRQW